MARRISLWTAPLLALAALVGIAVATAAWITPPCAGDTCPSLERLETYHPPAAPRVLDARGEVVAHLAGEVRTRLPLDSVPRIVRDGFVAVEDRRFREHAGIDLRGVARAAVRNLRAGGFDEGASTMTMQLVRNVWGADLLSWHPLRRKLAEAVLARELERRLSKDRILELYLNQIYLGDGTYGVEAAARHYLGHPVSQVTPREAAFLVGLAKNPEGYDPTAHPGAARQRIATVLRVMEREGVLDARDTRMARADTLRLRQRAPVRDWGDDAWYVSAVRRQVRELFPNPADRDGLRVHTALDRTAQAVAVERLREHLRAVEEGRFGDFPHPVEADAASAADGTDTERLQGMVVIMDSRTGAIQALAGGRDFGASEFDRALQARRQPGSAFKPVVYAAALRSGLHMNELVPTAPVRWTDRGTDPWRLADDETEARAIRLREALVRSSNVVAVRLGMQVGEDRVRVQARRMGIESELPSGPALHLGTGEVAPADLVAAYAAIENGGRRVVPHLVTRVESADGEVLWDLDPDTLAGERVLDPARAFLLLDGLREVATRGTGWRVGQRLGTEAAGKTGTTDEVKDVWFVGMTPGRAAGVWLGFDRPRTIVPGGSGGTLAAPLWADVMGRVVEADTARSAPSWRPPVGVEQVRVSVRTGFVVPEWCDAPGEVRTEWMLAGARKSSYCPSTLPRGDTPLVAPPIRAVERRGADTDEGNGGVPRGLGSVPEELPEVEEGGPPIRR